jgi:hypothetical protein
VTLLKACSDCGTPTDRARCPDCQRPAAPKESATARGYDAAWERLSKRARRLQPFCSDCGTTEDLTTDHSEAAWKRKDAGKPIRLVDVTSCAGAATRSEEPRGLGGSTRLGLVPDPRGRQNPRLYCLPSLAQSFASSSGVPLVGSQDNHAVGLR